MSNIIKPMKWAMAVDLKKEENIRIMRNALEEATREFPVFLSPVIGEKRRDSRYLFGRKNPARTSETVSGTAFVDAKMMQEAVEIAKEGQRKWEKVPVQERIRIIEGARSLLAKEEETGYRPRARFFELASSLTKNDGFSQNESLEEIREVVDHISLPIWWAYRNLLLPESSLYQMPGETNEYLRRPMGVVAAISPFNFPQAIPAADIAPALICGNSILFKPSEKAALPGYRLCQIFWEAGVPKDVLLFVPGEGRVAARFIAQCPDIFFFTFTGSQEVGFDLLGRWAESVTRYKKMRRAPYLETGGKNVMYIDRNTDMRRVIPSIIQSGFGRANEKCSALSVILVHKDAYGEFCGLLKDSVQSSLGMRDPHTGNFVIVGDPSSDNNVFFGSVIDESHKHRVEGFIERGKKDAKVLVEIPLENEKFASRGHFVNPIVFHDLPEDHELVTKEIFGPVLCVMPVRDENHAIEFANSRDYDLTRGDVSNLQSVREKFRDWGKQGAAYDIHTTGNVPGQGFVGFTKSTDSGPGRGFPDYPERFCVKSFHNENRRFYGEIIDSSDLGIDEEKSKYQYPNYDDVE